jgi:hypothetical protein
MESLTPSPSPERRGGKVSGNGVSTISEGSEGMHNPEMHDIIRMADDGFSSHPAPCP